MNMQQNTLNVFALVKLLVLVNNELKKNGNESKIPS